MCVGWRALVVQYWRGRKVCMEEKVWLVLTVQTQQSQTTQYKLSISDDEDLLFANITPSFVGEDCYW
jgi:hypothetical protein